MGFFDDTLGLGKIFGSGNIGTPEVAPTQAEVDQEDAVLSAVRSDITRKNATALSSSNMSGAAFIQAQQDGAGAMSQPTPDVRSIKDILIEREAPKVAASAKFKEDEIQKIMQPNAFGSSASRTTAEASFNRGGRA